MTRRRRKNAGEGYGMMFHGAFADKSEAVKKERKVHGFIKPSNIKGKRRYVVMSERKNPIRRKKKANPVAGQERVPFRVEFKRKGVAQVWERFHYTIDEATKSARKALREEFPDGDYKLIRVSPARPNPAELVVMGANPSATTGTPHEITLPPGSILTIRMNPSAAALRETFTGRPADWETVSNEPHMPAGDYAQLGELLALYVKPRRGAQVQTISFKQDRPALVSDESARQMYFVGGNQDISGGLSAFGATDRGGGLFELGEVRRIDYKQRKEHVSQPDADEWRHDFGEETGVRPVLIFDAGKRRLLLEGGEYEVRTEGIVN